MSGAHNHKITLKAEHWQESNSRHFTLNDNNLSKHYSAEITFLGGFPAVQTTSIPPDSPSILQTPRASLLESERRRNLIPQPEPTSTETNLRSCRFPPAIPGRFSCPRQGRRGWSSRSARQDPQPVLRSPAPSRGIPAPHLGYYTHSVARLWKSVSSTARSRGTKGKKNQRESSLGKAAGWGLRAGSGPARGSAAREAPDPPGSGAGFWSPGWHLLSL